MKCFQSRSVVILDLCVWGGGGGGGAGDWILNQSLKCLNAPLPALEEISIPTTTPPKEVMSLRVLNI